MYIINTFKDKLFSGKKVIAVELDSPINTDIGYVMEASRAAKNAGADIVTVTDSPLARTRADSIVIAAKVKRETGIDVIPHLSCRDKNHIGIKSSLLAASVENINNILAITGDPIAQSDRSEYKGVFSFNSFNLISYIDSMNSDVFTDDPFFIGGALNVNSLLFANELKRAQKKINSGAGFLMTQPALSQYSIENIKIAHKELKCKIITGVLPVASYRNAVFLKNEVFGIDIPDKLISELENKSFEEVFKISVAFSIEIIDKTFDYSDGYYLITPLKRIDLMKELVRHICKKNEKTY